MTPAKTIAHDIGADDLLSLVHDPLAFAKAFDEAIADARHLALADALATIDQPTEMETGYAARVIIRKRVRALLDATPEAKP